jgi:RNA polymerase sigma factor (sigma-70 family)
MKATKEEIGKMFEEHQDYIKKIVASFLKLYPTFYYMMDDLVGECNYRFVGIVKKFDEDKSKFTTFLFDQCWHYLQKVINKETRRSMGEEAYVVQAKKNDRYEMSYFEKLLQTGECTPMQCEILRCRYIAGMSFEEIAQELGTSKQACQQAEARALTKLRDAV